MADLLPASTNPVSFLSPSIHVFWDKVFIHYTLHALSAWKILAEDNIPIIIAKILTIIPSLDVNNTSTKDEKQTKTYLANSIDPPFWRLKEAVIKVTGYRKIL